MPTEPAAPVTDDAADRGADWATQGDAVAAALDKLNARLAVIETQQAWLVTQAANMAAGVERIRNMVEQVQQGGIGTLLRGSKRERERERG